ncbi:hypothetical protein GCM10009530_12450 [Microbispora corallina]|uniref:Uncharacterized protein n=1 Tax=Microbispora corallina TaxID=83302 RepID=A0ABQ4FTM3_9ACTN|nr:hypothetical protein [Microbispora corallina]GIH38058.1 hypothetical protein Mco01_10580 [Microbispora corallina]
MAGSGERPTPPHDPSHDRPTPDGETRDTPTPDGGATHDTPAPDREPLDVPAPDGVTQDAPPGAEPEPGAEDTDKTRPLRRKPARPAPPQPVVSTQPDRPAPPPPVVPPPRHPVARPAGPPPPHPLAMGRPGQFSTPKPSGGSKSSTAIKLGTLGVLSTLVVGFCAAQNRYDEVGADCVDLSNRQPDGSYPVVPDDYCDDDHHYHGSHGAYGWYYGGTRTGGRVWRGTTVKPADAHITSRTGRVIQRGGFGFHSGGGG